MLLQKVIVLIDRQLNYVAQLIKCIAESTDQKMVFHSQETEIKLLLNAQRKTKKSCP